LNVFIIELKVETCEPLNPSAKNINAKVCGENSWVAPPDPCLANTYIAFGVVVAV
jgi:hypothetical protein